MVGVAVCICCVPDAMWLADSAMTSGSLGRYRTALRQGAHLGSDHGEATALLTSACCLDCGVEREDVGLEGDTFDDADDFAHLAGGHVDRPHGFAHFVHSVATFADDAIASGAFSATCAAVSAVWRTVLASCSMEAAVSSRLLACDSVRADRSRPPGASGGRAGEAADFLAHVTHHGLQLTWIWRRLLSMAQGRWVVRLHTETQLQPASASAKPCACVEGAHHTRLKPHQHRACADQQGGQLDQQPLGRWRRPKGQRRMPNRIMPPGPAQARTQGHAQRPAQPRTPGRAPSPPCKSKGHFAPWALARIWAYSASAPATSSRLGYVRTDMYPVGLPFFRVGVTSACTQ